MPQNVTLDTIGSGALTELFSAELGRVLANIADPNTDIKTKRTITLTVSFKPNRDRDVADVEMKCGSKLAGIMGVETQLFVGLHQGHLIAVESDPKQSALFDEPKPGAAVASGTFGKGGK